MPLTKVVAYVFSVRIGVWMPTITYTRSHQSNARRYHRLLEGYHRSITLAIGRLPLLKDYSLSFIGSSLCF